MLPHARFVSFMAVLIWPQTAALAQTTVEFYSPSVNRTMKYNIVLPLAYGSSSERYPVLYLLHGLTFNYRDWSAFGVPEYAEVFEDLIVVMPDGGNSWYVNYAESSRDQRNDWEDYIVQDVIGHVDRNFRTIARREARAISGLSMGGYGALTIGLHHPELFASIGSTSGALGYGRRASRRFRGGSIRAVWPPPSPEDLRRQKESEARIDILGFTTQTERTPDGIQFLTAEDADWYDPFQLIHQVPRDQLPHIYLDSGTGDLLITEAREFAQVLLFNDIPFDFMQMRGGHDPVYWTQSVGHLISVQYEVMRRALGERPCFPSGCSNDG